MSGLASRSFGRRRFAHSVDAGFLLSPFMRLGAHAAPARRAKRLLLFCTMGTQPEIWAPPHAVAENDFTWSACTEPLMAIREHVVMIDGLPTANPTNQHGAPDGLTGLGYQYLETPALVSVDQFVADQLELRGIRRPIPTLLLGSGTNLAGGLTMFFRNLNLATINSPMAAFQTAFGRTVTSGPSPEVLLRRRRSIVDLVKSEVSDLQRAVGTEERARLETHLDSFRQLEKRLAPIGAVPQSRCSPNPPADESSLEHVQKNLLHLDVIVSAFACDVTRVAAIEFGSDQSLPVNLPELGLQGDQHGQFIHAGRPDYKDMIAFERWLAGCLVDTVNKLKAIPEADGSGTLFDNTLIAWCRDMGDAHLHNQKSMRFVLVGGAGGYLAMDPNGRYLLGTADGPSNRHERVLLSICEAMGIDNFTGFGDPRLGADKTPFPGIAAR